jgi:predicted lipoprotein with Yx(FWY)xxD motif
MSYFKRSVVIVACLLCVLCLAACGSAANANGTTASSQAVSNPATNGNNTIAAPQATQAAMQDTQVKSMDDNSTTPTSQNSGKQATSNTVNKQITTAAPANTTANTNQAMQNASTSNQQVASTNTSSANSNSNASANNNTITSNASTTNTSTNTGNNTGTNTYVRVVQTNINGQMANVLADGNGMTLYYTNNDTNSQSTCTGACAQSWPPFLVEGQIITSQSLPGTLIVRSTANGNQLIYNGHPLYKYSGDNAPGQVNGQGDGGVWYTITVAIQKQHW